MADPSPFIRPYDPSRDYEDGLHVYLTTMDPTLDYEPARTIGAHLWYTPYVVLTPSTCIVLDSGSSSPNRTVVGYCIGCASTLGFSKKYVEAFVPGVDRSLVPPLDTTATKDDNGNDEKMESELIRHFRKAVYEGDCSMLLPFPEELEEFSAHLHIDILPEFQRKGWGTKLIEAFFEAVRKKGARGVHLDMVEGNKEARAFYESVGFRVCERVLDGGESGRTGVNGGVVTLVREL